MLWEDSTGFVDPKDGLGYFHHYGASISVGPDGLLYMSYGDKAQDPTNFKKNLAQDITEPTGCIIRINKDGTFPEGNIQGKKADPGCWVIGVRNGYKAAWYDAVSAVPIC